MADVKGGGVNAEGLFTKLHLTVTARTRLGQSVHVSGSSSASLNGSSTAAESPETLPMVTSPSEWPVWRTLKPIIISRNVSHTYQYSLSNGQLESAEGRTRTIRAEGSTMSVQDTFGLFEGELVSAAQSSPKPSLPRLDSLLRDRKARLQIVCYHLPVRILKEKNKWVAYWAESLIARSGEGSVANQLDTYWIGTVSPEGHSVLTEKDKNAIRNVLEPMNCLPLFSKHAHAAYSGYCKNVLWPSFHNVDILDQTCACWNDDQTVEAACVKWDQGAVELGWGTYEKMNEDFRDAIVEIVKEGDTVWVHDYHLMLLPSLLANTEVFKSDLFAKRKARIVFFMHIPFPTSQLFRSLTHGEELLNGIVGADVVGFHAFDHARHFLNACKRLMGLPHKSVQGGITGVEYQGRTVMVVVRYVSVEPERVLASLESAECQGKAADILAAIPPNKIVLSSVDACQRLAGIALKLVAFERFLYEYERWRAPVVLIQYALLDGKRPEDEERTSGELKVLVERINRAFPGAVVYKEMAASSLELADRLALWSVTSVLVSTAIREGHVLLPFEFVLARRDDPGVCLASEFSATASLLNGALRINPFDPHSVAAALDTALSMPKAERAARHARDLPYVVSRPSGKWTLDILQDMWLVNRQKKISSEEEKTPEELAIPLDLDALRSSFTAAKRRVLVLDFGGTLVEKGAPMGKHVKRTSSVSSDKKHALPDALAEALERLSADERTTIFIVSGATMHALMSTLGHWPKIGLAASNGLCYSHPIKDSKQRHASKREYEFSDYGTDWSKVKQTALPIFKRYTARTNGSRILSREPGVAWSYYRTDPEWGRIQAELLVGELDSALGAYDVRIQHLDGMIEMMPKRSHKGNVVKEILAAASNDGEQPDFILCAGDGSSDEKMFSSVYSALADSNAEFDSHHAFTVTVGKKPSRALFYLKDHAHVVETLTKLGEVA